MAPEGRSGHIPGPIGPACLPPARTTVILVPVSLLVVNSEHARARALLTQLGVAPPYKPVWFCGSSKEELSAMPRPVVREMGVALRAAQGGRHHPNAKPYTTAKQKGWSVVEVVADFNTDTYRLVYTVHFPDVVFVLYGFQKKSKKGRATPKPDKAMVERRYQEAQAVSKNPSPGLVTLIKKYRAEVAASASAKKGTGSNPRKR